MAKKVLFWLGVGVININGKDYGAEMPLPVDGIDPADLSKMEKDGRIGERIAISSDGCRDCAAHLETVEAKNSLIKERDLRIVELEALADDKDAIINGLEDDIKEAADKKAIHVAAHTGKTDNKKDSKK